MGVTEDILEQAKAEGDSELVAAASEALKVNAAVTAQKAGSSSPSIKKWTPSAFMKQFSRTRGDPEKLASLLRTVNSLHLPRLFSNRLEAADIVAVFKALSSPWLADAGAAYALMRGITQVNRFDMVT